MEEDIKILQELIAFLNTNGNYIADENFKEEKLAIENLIKGYRELEEKNRRKIIGRIDEIKIEDLEDVLKPYYIPKSKIKENIKKYAEQFVETEQMEDELNFYILEDK